MFELSVTFVEQNFSWKERFQVLFSGKRRFQHHELIHCARIAIEKGWISRNDILFIKSGEVMHEIVKGDFKSCS